MSPTGDLAHNPRMCPDWESNQWPFSSQAGTQSTEPYPPELASLFFFLIFIVIQLQLYAYLFFNFSFFDLSLSDSCPKSLGLGQGLGICVFHRFRRWFWCGPFKSSTTKVLQSHYDVRNTALIVGQLSLICLISSLASGKPFDLPEYLFSNLVNRILISGILLQSKF